MVLTLYKKFPVLYNEPVWGKNSPSKKVYYAVKNSNKNGGNNHVCKSCY